MNQAGHSQRRELQHSALCRIWSALPDFRDWVSYVYVPILLLILVLLPYLVVKSYQRAHRVGQIVDSLAQGSRDCRNDQVAGRSGEALDW